MNIKIPRIPNPFRDLREARELLDEVLRERNSLFQQARDLQETLQAERTNSAALSCELRVARRQIASRDAKIKAMTLRGQDTAQWLSQVIEEVKTARRPDAEIIEFPRREETVN